MDKWTARLTFGLKILKTTATRLARYSNFLWRLEMMISVDAQTGDQQESDNILDDNAIFNMPGCNNAIHGVAPKYYHNIPSIQHWWMINCNSIGIFVSKHLFGQFFFFEKYWNLKTEEMLKRLIFLNGHLFICLLTISIIIIGFSWLAIWPI